MLRHLRSVHPYEEPAIDCLPLVNELPTVGAGMVGQIENPINAAVFLNIVKQRLGLGVVRASHFDHQAMVGRVAICGGAGSFLIGDAKASGADIYLTSDLKYHDFQSAEGDIILADIGHFESEQFAKELFYNVISEKFSNFVCQISTHDSGYICYI